MALEEQPITRSGLRAGCFNGGEDAWRVLMTTKAREDTSGKVKKQLESVRSEWLIAELAKGLDEIERGETCEIEIDADKGEYRVVQASIGRPLPS